MGADFAGADAGAGGEIGRSARGGRGTGTIRRNSSGVAKGLERPSEVVASSKQHSPKVRFVHSGGSLGSAKRNTNSTSHS